MSEEELEDRKWAALAELAAHKAAPLFQLFGWKWAGVDGDGVPRVNDIEAAVARYLDTLHTEKFGATGSGRIWVTRDYDGGCYDYSVHLELGSLYRVGK